MPELHCRDPVGDDWWGTRYYGPGDDLDDIYPCYFHNVLIDWIGLKREPVVMVINSSEPVWNYPAYKYEMNI